MKILFFGDVYGKAGRLALLNAISGLRNEFRPDFMIANGENLADGKGLTEKTLNPLLNAGVDVITGGNHLWDRVEALDYIKTQASIVKPLNYPESAPGNHCAFICKGNVSLRVISLSGQIYMPPCNNPFETLDKFLASQTGHCPIVLDFHAESTSEKRAMGWFADGRVNAVLGTHTHIQTADEEILPLGTAYITDVGMTGSHDSVIGVRKEIIIQKMQSGIPIRYVSSDLGLQVNAVLVELSDTGMATSITRIKRNVSLNPNIAQLTGKMEELV